MHKVFELFMTNLDLDILFQDYEPPQRFRSDERRISRIWPPKAFSLVFTIVLHDASAVYLLPPLAFAQCRNLGFHMRALSALAIRRPGPLTWLLSERYIRARSLL